MRRKHFAVDEWRCQSDAYFLTHLHADHIEGLSADWCRGPLYCSQVTALLLLAKFKGFNAALLRILEVGAPTLVSHNNVSLLEVTAIDADHCPGAVMFVFHGEFGCIVHTGDFRWNNDRRSLEERKSQVEQALGGIQVDFLYIDNTFCNPTFSFPSRNEAANKVIELIRSYPDHDIVIGLDNLGKEELLVCIAETLKLKICVWPQRLRTMHLLQLPDVFTTDTTITRIRAIPRCTVSTQCLKLLNELRPTIGILPTGCLCLCNPSSGRKLKSKHCSEGCYKAQDRLYQNVEKPISSWIYVVPYSLHCCYSELMEFYELIRPRMVVGIVKSPSEYSTHPFRHLSLSATITRPVETTRSEDASVQLADQSSIDCGKALQNLQSKCSKKPRLFVARKRQRLHGRGAKLCTD